MSADRNLLFGMLALHTAAIDRDQLLEALNAWMLRKDVPLGDILRERGALSEEDHRQVEAVVARHLRRHGDAQKSLAQLPVRPEDRRELEQLRDPDVQASLASLKGKMDTPPAKTDTSFPATQISGEEARPPSTGLRYRRLRLHAKGGLGEVHVALDEELHREVALKQIQEQYANDHASRRRFVREAEITGKLEHPGVVPVYGLGEYPDGRPLYAMRFIKGESLDDAIARHHRQP